MADSPSRQTGGTEWRTRRSSARDTTTPPLPTKSARSSWPGARRSGGSSAFWSLLHWSCFSWCRSPTSLSSAWASGAFTIPIGMGLCDHQLRLVDRNRPRRHADFRDFASVAAAVAHFDQPVCGSDDAVRRFLRGNISADPHGPSVARLLALSVSRHDEDVAQFPEPAGVGRVCGFDLCDGVAAVLVHRPDSGPRDACATAPKIAPRK